MAIKFFTDKKDYVVEKYNVLRLKNIFLDDDSFKKHLFLYCDDKTYCIMYNYLGKRINNDFIIDLTLEQKIDIIIQIIEQSIKLHDSNLLQNDIKPENIVFDIKENNILSVSVIDWGILYNFPTDFIKGYKFDTTLWSASPEYLKIAQLSNDIEPLLTHKTESNIRFIEDRYYDDIKDIFFKSQHFAISGIIIGLFVNNIAFYFETLLKYVNIEETYNMELKYSQFTKSTMSKIIKKINDKLTESEIYYGKNIFDRVKNLIFSMLEYDYNKRIKLNDVMTELVYILTLVKKIDS